jgi:serine/threonine-protein kinase
MKNEEIEAQLQELLAGSYQIERELGRGAMARVFLAKDLKHPREVAVKLLPPELATPTAAERFLREIRITARLQHPHILQLMDSGAASGLCWYIMPYVTGESLRVKLSKGQMGIKEATRTAVEVANALGYAHREDVIHRDIKPENIMLSGTHAIVMDFGLARALGATQSSVTVAGLPIGTPVYMSPEQVIGQGELDARTDIYSLGCVFYEMMTGQPPFSGNLTAVMRGHMEGKATPPTQIRPDAPPPVDGIVEKAMAKSPGDRYQTAEEMIDDLEMVLAYATLGAAALQGRTSAASPAVQDEGKSGWKKFMGKFGKG